MKFVSTRNIDEKVSFREAVFRGLAPDGGLYQPASQPDLRKLLLSFDETTSFTDIAEAMTRNLFSEELTPRQCRKLAKSAFTFQPELHTLAANHELLELFHGPSCAFKDFGASFLANLMQVFLAEDNKRAIILTATSGDTGSAVAQAFYGKSAIDVVILYPSGRVSPSQELQLTTVGGNVHALEVEGNFDDCQRMVKEAFLNPSLIGTYPLTSANSINLGRLIPQSFYYVWAFAQLKHRVSGDFYFCVPSGNFGNLTAGVLAWTWGLPVSGFVAATNSNDVVPEYLARGSYQPRPSLQTYSNAMDVGNPSNFERLLQIFSNDWTRMRTMIHGRVYTDEQTLETMKIYRAEHGVFLCPHTAVGVRAGEDAAGTIMIKDDMMVTLSTAHPGKFGETVELATGELPPIPERLAVFMRRKKESVLIGNRLEDLVGYLRAKF